MKLVWKNIKVRRENYMYVGWMDVGFALKMSYSNTHTHTHNYKQTHTNT